MNIGDVLKEKVIEELKKKMKPLEEKSILTKEEGEELDKYKEAIEKVRNKK